MNTPPKRPPPHQPTDATRKTVESMAAYGIPHGDIGKVVGGEKPLSAPSVRRLYRDELTRGAIMANAQVGQSLFRQAAGAPAEYDDQGRLLRAEVKPVVVAGIWWTKARMGWKETQVVEGPGKGGSHKVEHAAYKVVIDADDAKV